jgi:hypothetical protein
VGPDLDRVDEALDARHVAHLLQVLLLGEDLSVLVQPPHPDLFLYQVGLDVVQHL